MAVRTQATAWSGVMLALLLVGLLVFGARIIVDPPEPDPPPSTDQPEEVNGPPSSDERFPMPDPDRTGWPLPQRPENPQPQPGPSDSGSPGPGRPDLARYASPASASRLGA